MCKVTVFVCIDGDGVSDGGINDSYLPVSLTRAQLGMRYCGRFISREHLFYRAIYMSISKTVFQIIIFTVKVSQALSNLGRGQL